MTKEFFVRTKEGDTYCVSFNFLNCSINTLYLRDVLFLSAYKIHAHLYEVRYFLYEKKVICITSFKTFKEMCFEIQKILEEDLHLFVQNRR